MVRLKELEVETILDKAIHQLKHDDDFQLVSITRKIKDINPFVFFDAAKKLEKNRTFWASSEKDLYFVGVGQAYEIVGYEERFTETKESWMNIIRTATIHNPYDVPGTGVVALGGLAFDSNKPTTPLWENYAPSAFTIPEFLLTKNNGQCYLTTNIVARKNDHPTQLANVIKEAEMRLFHEFTITKQFLTLVEKNEIEPEEWMESVRKAKEHIANSEVEKIVMAREVRLKFQEEANIGSILENLYASQPNSYIFAYEKGSDCFLGATPERLVKLEGDELLSTCLAGTAPRGETLVTDRELSERLLNDPKNRQEHEFVVQMIKKAMENCCSNLQIPSEPVIYPLKNLQHLYTPVTGILKDGYSLLDVVEKLHPTPALGGTPKDLSLSFIREHERLDRGWYGAPIGWMDSNQNGEFAVAIRSALVQGNEASLFAGCGVVKDSNPDEEYEETNIKFLPMLSVLGG